MHNGIKVIKDGYCGCWMTDLIYGLKGHHEPQEEKAFQEVLKYMPSQAVMIELGSFWGYYSLWFAKQVEISSNYLVEPDPWRLELGRQNFLLNQKEGHFTRGYVGTCNSDAGDYHHANSIMIDSFIEQYQLRHVNLLHSDIQGAEFEMLLSAINSIESGKIDYFFISTHAQTLHEECINFLKSHHYQILAEHSQDESFSVDGLIVAKREGVAGPDKIAISKITNL